MADAIHTDQLPEQDTLRLGKRSPRRVDASGAPASRQAAFRPAEAIASRQDILRDFILGVDRDTSLLPQTPEQAWQDALILQAVDEARGDWDALLARHDALTRQHGDAPPDAWRVARRAARQRGDLAQIQRTLGASMDLEVGAAEALARLESAQLSWAHEEPREVVALSLSSVTLPPQTDDATRAFIALWRAQLTIDAQLSVGEVQCALETLGAWIAEEGARAPVEIARRVRAQRALWLMACGQLDEAAEALEALIAEGGEALPALLDALVGLRLSRGELLEAQALALSAAAKRASASLPAATVGSLAALASQRDPTRARALLRVALDAGQLDDAALRLYERLLDDAALSDSEDAATAREALTRVLSQRLERALEPHVRVDALLRLGRLYEADGADEAACEVFREALQLAPAQPAVLRALGRVYDRRQDWASLAALYEHEIQALDGAPEVWRRHFQAAELYERRLQELDRALMHYRHVLGRKPADLPALKGAARILEQRGQWHTLADLFLVSVEATTSQRQRLYMLDRVAEIAEQHLNHAEIAIGAWEEIVKLNPQHPTAYASLGRLYHRTKRWVALIALNTQELALIDDAEERAGMCLRNAEIAQSKLKDHAQAEAHYQRALSEVSDYLPALEGLGRLYLSAGRWDALAAMTHREFGALQSRREQVRQLGALAQVCEEQLGRPEDAISLLQEALRRDSADLNAYCALERLHRRLGQWQALDGLWRWRLERTTRPAEVSSLHGELGQLWESELRDPARALAHYQAALCADPTQVAWLEGLCRVWARAGQEAHAVAAWLEANLAGQLTAPEARARLATILGRLHELATQLPEAGAMWREGAVSLEDDAVRRLTLGIFGERQALEALRVSRPWHSWEQLAAMPRHGLTEQLGAQLDGLVQTLGGDARQWWLSELALDAQRALPAGRAPRAHWLGLDLMRLLEGESPGQGGARCEAAPGRARLRALTARQDERWEEHALWTHRELERMTSASLRVRRVLELARAPHLNAAERDALLAEAVEVAFPATGGDLAHMDALDELYQSLYEAPAWALARRALERHVTHPEVKRTSRAFLYDALADVLERDAGEPEGALQARAQAWELGRDPAQLEAMVRLSESLGLLHDSIEYQHELYEALATQPEVDQARRVAAGLKLVALMQREAQHEDAITMLEVLREEFEHAPEASQIELQLARALSGGADYARAGRLFKRALTGREVATQLDAWREWIALTRGPLRDVRGAYALQWSVVRASTQDEDWALLLTLARQLDVLDACAAEIMRLAGLAQGDARRALLGRALALYDGELARPDEAARAYLELEGCLQPGEEAWWAARRKRATCLSRITGKHGEAFALFQELMRRDPFDADTYLGVAPLLERVQTLDRARVNKQLLRTLGQPVTLERERTKTIPSRLLEEARVLTSLLPEGMSEPLLDAFYEAAPLMTRCFGELTLQRKALDSDRKALRDLAPVADLFAITFDAVGLRKMTVQFGEALDVPMAVLWDREPLVWLNIHALGDFDEAALRFLAGYAAALAWTQVPGLVNMDARLVWHLFDGVLGRQRSGQGLRGEVGKAGAQLAEPVAGAMHLSARRRLVEALEPLLDTLPSCDPVAWSAQLDGFACRLGLVLCGDLEAAARAILRLRGWREPLEHPDTQRALREDARLADLFAFVLDDAYLQVRHALGLSGRPSTLAW